MRKIRFLICILLVIVIFSSCGFKKYENIIFNKTEENYGDTGGLNLPVDINNTEIKIMLVSDTEDLSDSLVVKELSRRTGLNVNIINVMPSDAMRQTQLFLSTNELPDIVKTTLAKDEINTLGKKGTFVSINKYLNELPNFRRIFIENERYNSLINNYIASDNNLYFYPSFNYRKEFTHGFLYRKDIFEKSNIPVWNNNEEFYEALKKLKELYPDSTPYVSQSEKNIFDEWSLSFGIDFPGMFYDSERGKWIYSGCDNRFNEMVEFIKKLYDEKLIDPMFLNTSSYLWDWKIAEGNGFVTYGELSSMDAFFEKSKNETPDFNLSIATPPGGKLRIKKNSEIGMGPCVTNNKNSLLSLKLLDYLASPSGIELSTLGVLNKTYGYKDDEIIYPDFENKVNIPLKKYEEKFGLFIPDLYRSVDKRSPCMKYSKKEQEAVDEIYKSYTVVEEYPKVNLTDDEREKAEEIENLLNNKAYEYATNYILGLADKKFSEWVLDANKLGLMELEALYNK